MSTGTNTGQSPASPPSQEKGKAGPALQSEAKAAQQTREEPDINACANIEVSGDTWLDQTHDYVERNICEPAVWFDHFFGDRRVLEDVRPGTFIRLRNAVRLTDGKNVKYISDIQVLYRLPKWENLLRKASIYFESRSDAPKYTLQPGQPIEPGVNPATGVKQSVIGVRADLYARLRQLIDIDTGLMVSIHPDAFVRMRYQFLKPFGEVYLIRFSQIPMWQTIEHFSDTTQLDLERTITKFTIVRWSNNVTFIEKRPGVTWNTGISFITQLTAKSAISNDTSMWGVNSPVWTIQNYRVGSRFRQNFYRPWLFFELAPEITWPQDASQIDYRGKGKPVKVFMATLEIQFGK